jgi:hypothetical protein
MLLNRQNRKTAIHEWELSRRAEMESKDKNLMGNILHIFDFIPNYTCTMIVPFWYILYTSSEWYYSYL